MAGPGKSRTAFRSNFGRGSTIVAVAFAGLLFGVAGWVITDAIERNNDFCTACHLRPEVPLHIGNRQDFDMRPAASLAGLHGAADVAGRAVRKATQCIDCHRGVGWVGRAEVKLLAARDALVWLTGDFDEPKGMSHPLGEADCRQCHEAFLQPDEATIERAFHARSVHNADLGVLCVECHTVHEGGADPALFFLDSRKVRVQCARCHSEFQESQ